MKKKVKEEEGRDRGRGNRKRCGMREDKRGKGGKKPKEGKQKGGKEGEGIRERCGMRERGKEAKGWKGESY